MVGGTYSIVLKTPLGAKKGTLKLTEKGGALTGSLSVLGVRVRISSGKCEGGSFAFSSGLKTPVRKLSCTCDGCVTEDTLKGVVRTSRGNMPISGTRIG